MRDANADTVHVPATDDKPVDTVGAGDAFMGALAYFLGSGMHMDDAIRRANVVAGHSVTRPGTQTSSISGSPKASQGMILINRT